MSKMEYHCCSNAHFYYYYHCFYSLLIQQISQICEFIVCTSIIVTIISTSIIAIVNLIVAIVSKLHFPPLARVHFVLQMHQSSPKLVAYQLPKQSRCRPMMTVTNDTLSQHTC